MYVSTIFKNPLEAAGRVTLLEAEGRVTLFVAESHGCPLN